MILSMDYREFGETTCFREVLDDILKELPELSWGGPESKGRIINSTEELNERIEITVRDSQGALVGFAVVTDDEDAHVGPCLGTQWHWVAPAHRGPVGRMILREIFRVARLTNHNIVAYTKRLGVGKYEINYLQLKEKPNG